MDGNHYILLTILRNSELQVRSRIAKVEEAKDAWNTLKQAYEGRTATEFHSLLRSLVYLHYDDRIHTISEHITAYEKLWNTFSGIIAWADLTKDTGFGKGLLAFSRCEQVKTEFLLMSLPTFYASTVENVRSKEQTYDDTARKINEYITARQKGQNQQSRKRIHPGRRNQP